RPGSLVDLDEGLFLGGREIALLLPLALEEVEVAHEALEERLVLVAEGAQQDEQAEAALAGHARAGGDVLAGLGLDVELDPLTAVGMDGAGDDGIDVAAGLEDHTGTAHELGHGDPLGAGDDEGAL